MAEQNNTQNIVKVFKHFDSIYRNEQVDAAIAARTEITPHLLRLLEEVLVEPVIYAKRENIFTHIFALIILGYFKETKAHQVILGLFSLPGRLSDELFGDIITGELPTIMLQTCGSSLDGVKALILNKNAYEYCRIAAIQTLAYAVIEGMIDREETLQFYSQLFNGTEASPPAAFLDNVACSICDLYPDGFINIIKKAYEDNLIDQGYIGYDEFEEALTIGKEDCLNGLKRKLDKNRIVDLHGLLSNWVCFQLDTPEFATIN